MAGILTQDVELALGSVLQARVGDDEIGDEDMDLYVATVKSNSTKLVNVNRNELEAAIKDLWESLLDQRKFQLPRGNEKNVSPLGSKSNLGRRSTTPNHINLSDVNLSDYFASAVGNRQEHEIKPQDVLGASQQGELIEGWLKREELEAYLELAVGTLSRCSEVQTSALIGYVLQASKWINDTKKNERAKLLTGSAITFDVNGKKLVILSNAGMDESRARKVNGPMFTTKVAFAIIAPALEEYLLKNPVPILEVQSLSWSKNYIRKIFKRPLNLLLSIDGVQNGYDWKSADYKVDGHKSKHVDPSYAWGITFAGIYKALKLSKSSDVAEDIAAKSATKKVTRLISAGYKVTSTVAMAASVMVQKSHGVDREVASKVRESIDSGRAMNVYNEIVKEWEEVRITAKAYGNARRNREGHDETMKILEGTRSRDQITSFKTYAREVPEIIAETYRIDWATK